MQQLYALGHEQTEIQQEVDVCRRGTSLLQKTVFVYTAWSLLLWVVIGCVNERVFMFSCFDQ